MRRIHQQEKEQLKKLFRQERIDRFEDRFKVLEAFFGTERHVTAEELAESMEDAAPPPPLVAETLDMMCHFGFAQANRFDNGVVRYEHRHLGLHHDHMICTRCRRIIEFTDEALEALQEQIAGAHGFHMLWHRMEIYGICDACLAERVQQVPLVAARQGERLIIREFTGGTTSRMRLLTMGLRVGDEIEVITNLSKGQVVVAADHHRYALGRGLARKILVEPAAPPAPAAAGAAR